MTYIPENYIQLYDGTLFDIDNPTVDMINIENIAHSLAMQCRYNGHCIKFLSVAEHCCHIYDAVCEDHLSNYDLHMMALLHDADETCGTVDIARPLKYKLPDFLAYQKKYSKLIAQKFGLEALENHIVKWYDTRMLKTERLQNMVMNPDVPWFVDSDDWVPIHVELEYWEPERAKEEFLYRYHEIKLNEQNDKHK